MAPASEGVALNVTMAPEQIEFPDPDTMLTEGAMPVVISMKISLLRALAGIAHWALLIITHEIVSPSANALVI